MVSSAVEVVKLHPSHLILGSSTIPYRAKIRNPATVAAPGAPTAAGLFERMRAADGRKLYEEQQVWAAHRSKQGARLRGKEKAPLSADEVAIVQRARGTQLRTVSERHAGQRPATAADARVKRTCSCSCSASQTFSTTCHDFLERKESDLRQGAASGHHERAVRMNARTRAAGAAGRASRHRAVSLLE